MASIAAAIAGTRSATAPATVASSAFISRAISRVGSRSTSASSGRNASVVRVSSWERRSRSREVEVMGGVLSVGAGGWNGAGTGYGGARPHEPLRVARCRCASASYDADRAGAAAS